jgi:hypothetical protein
VDRNSIHYTTLHYTMHFLITPGGLWGSKLHTVRLPDQFDLCSPRAGGLRNPVPASPTRTNRRLAGFPAAGTLSPRKQFSQYTWATVWSDGAGGCSRAAQALAAWLRGAACVVVGCVDGRSDLQRSAVVLFGLAGTPSDHVRGGLQEGWGSSRGAPLLGGSESALGGQGFGTAQPPTVRPLQARTRSSLWAEPTRAIGSPATTRLTPLTPPRIPPSLHPTDRQLTDGCAGPLRPEPESAP